MEYQNKIDADALAKFHREQEPLDAEALMLFRAGCTQTATWSEFTDRQRDHWRAVATKARKIHKGAASARDLARLALEASACDWDTAERIAAHIIANMPLFPRSANIDAAAMTLQANTHDGLENSKEWEDLTPQERDGWRHRAKMVIKAGLEA